MSTWRPPWSAQGQFKLTLLPPTQANNPVTARRPPGPGSTATLRGARGDPCTPRPGRRSGLAASMWPHNCGTYGTGRPAKTPVRTALGRRSMVRMGPAVGTAEALMRKPSSSRHLTSPLTVLRELRRCGLAWRSPPTRSHGGSQGFKSPHLHPQPRRSERRQHRAGGAHCKSRPRAHVAVQPGRLSETRRLGPGLPR
jgi:hypothetical protein